MTCDICKTDGHYRIRSIGDSLWACPDCVRAEPKETGIVVKEWVQVGSQRATRNQLKEMERRVILPYDKPGGGYYLGRRGENGRVQERAPDYRP